VNTRCVIGIGCDDHGDQVAGLLVARRIAALGPDDVAVHESTGAPGQLIAAWIGAGETVVVEAMPGAVPGAVSRCQPHPRPLAGGCSPTRLSPDLREALALGPLPERVTVITIAAQRFASCAGVSPEVAVAAHRVASMIVDAWSVPATADTSAMEVRAGV
jgi:hydrogenase maturation protease